MGCGLSVNDNTSALVKGIIKKCDLPLILDADALNIVSKNPDILKSAKRQVIITPHYMEMARLLHKDIDYVENNKFEVCKEFSKEYNVIVVLKGKETFVSSPDGRVMCNNSVGNVGMAKGGSGDVLAGIIASLAAQGNDPYKSACAGVYLHGLAGDIAKDKYGTMSMIPTDILKCLPDAFMELKI